VFTDRDIEYMASELRSSYKAKRTALANGRSVRISAKNLKLSTWLPAALVCLECGADPDNFIEACFAFSKLSLGPYPQMLASIGRKSWKAYSTRLIEGEDSTVTDSLKVIELKDLIKMRKDYYVKVSKTSNRSILDVMKTDYTVDPVVGVLLAEGNKEVETLHIQEAAKQLIKSKVLQDALRILSPGLLERILRA